jgi:hypothetical protein
MLHLQSQRINQNQQVPSVRLQCRIRNQSLSSSQTI